MNIGYGSVSAYDSIRHDLYLDKTSGLAYFVAGKKRYDIKLSDDTVKLVKQNKKKIWITLTQLPPSKINEDSKFECPTFDVM